MTKTKAEHYDCGICGEEFSGDDGGYSAYGKYTHHLYDEHRDNLGIENSKLTYTIQQVLVYQDNKNKGFSSVSGFLSEGARVLLLPRMENDDLRKNDNILTSPLYLLARLCEEHEVSIAHTDKDKDFDVVVSRFSGNAIEEEPRASLIESGKPYFEFDHDGLAGRWFIERFGIDGEWDDIMVKEDNVHEPKDEVLGFDVEKIHYGAF